MIQKWQFYGQVSFVLKLPGFFHQSFGTLTKADPDCWLWRFKRLRSEAFAPKPQVIRMYTRENIPKNKPFRKELHLSIFKGYNM